MNAQAIIPTTLRSNAPELVQALVNRYYYSYYCDKDLEIGGYGQPPFNITYPAGTTEEVKSATIHFARMWFYWWNSGRAQGFLDSIAALALEYDPISNYDKISDIIKGRYENGDTVTVTPSGTKTNTRTESGKETDTETKSGTRTSTDTYDKTDTTTGDVTTYENTAYRNDDQTTVGQAGTITTEESFDNYQTENEKSFTNRKTADVESFDQYKTETEREPNAFTKNIHNDAGQWTEYSHDYEHTSGNIGVTTSQDMIISEIRLRAQNIIDNYVTMFANENLFYC